MARLDGRVDLAAVARERGLERLGGRGREEVVQREQRLSRGGYMAVTWHEA